jgi:hypothetical protein
MRRELAVNVRLNGREMARLDELRGPTSRAEYLRRLLHGPPSESDPTHSEAMQILYGLAKDGRVGAAVALERALRADGDQHRPDGELARLLRGDD